MKKALKRVFNWLLILTGTASAVAIVFFAGDIQQRLEAPARVVYQATTTTEVVIKSDFEELKQQYMNSDEGAAVLDTWATQKALHDMRERLDAVEKDMLTREASL